MTTNEPDIADVWSVRFVGDSLAYEYDQTQRMATEWSEEIGIREGRRVKASRYTFKKTHHGPVIGRQSDGSYLAARIAGLYDVTPTRQAMRMMQARSFAQFRDAISLLQLPYMNILYADRDGNIFYVYGARCPRRDPEMQWDQPVDGNTSRDPVAGNSRTLRTTSGPQPASRLHSELQLVTLHDFGRRKPRSWAISALHDRRC